MRPSARFLDAYGSTGNAELARLAFRAVEAETIAAVEADPSLDFEGDGAALAYTKLQLTSEELTEVVTTLHALFTRYRDRTGPIEVSLFGSVVPLGPAVRGGMEVDR